LLAESSALDILSYLVSCLQVGSHADSRFTFDYG